MHCIDYYGHIIIVIISANVTEIPHMEVLKIVVSAMFGFHRFIRSCMLPCVLDELLVEAFTLKLFISKIIMDVKCNKNTHAWL